MQNSNQLFWILIGLCAATMFALISPFSIYTEQAGLLPVYSVFYRYIVIIIVATPIMLLFFRQYFKFNRQQYWLIILYACANAVLSITYLASFSFIPLSLAVIIFFTQPLITLMVVPFIFGDRLTTAKIIVFLMAFIGLIFVVGPEFSNLNGIGILLALIAAITAVIQLLCLSKLVKELNPVVLLYSGHFIAMFITVFIIVTLVYTGNLPPPVAITKAIIWPFAGLLGCYILAQTLFINVAKRLKPATISFISNIEPIVTVALAIWLFNESLSNVQAIGVVIVLTSLMIGSMFKENQQNEQPAE
ncbi:MAG: DMT family transporter [Rhizobiales bacterium]|nr:DMT family transporter [Hyphomicrobiales bacterium]NRB15662.1 DMT family transporter [Hyphomicrobiales bacterium]